MNKNIFDQLVKDKLEAVAPAYDPAAWEALSASMATAAHVPFWAKIPQWLWWNCGVWLLFGLLNWQWWLAQKEQWDTLRLQQMEILSQPATIRDTIWVFQQTPVGVQSGIYQAQIFSTGVPTSLSNWRYQRIGQPYSNIRLSAFSGEERFNRSTPYLAPTGSVFSYVSTIPTTSSSIATAKLFPETLDMARDMGPDLAWQANFSYDKQTSPSQKPMVTLPITDLQEPEHSPEITLLDSTIVAFPAATSLSDSLRALGLAPATKINMVAAPKAALVKPKKEKQPFSWQWHVGSEISTLFSFQAEAYPWLIGGMATNLRFSPQWSLNVAALWSRNVYDLERLSNRTDLERFPGFGQTQGSVATIEVYSSRLLLPLSLNYHYPISRKWEAVFTGGAVAEWLYSQKFEYYDGSGLELNHEKLNPKERQWIFAELGMGLRYAFRAPWCFYTQAHLWHGLNNTGAEQVQISGIGMKMGIQYRIR